MHQILRTWKDNPKHSKSRYFKSSEFQGPASLPKGKESQHPMGRKICGPHRGDACVGSGEGGGEERDLLVMGIESSSSIQSLTLPNELSNATHFFVCMSPKRSVKVKVKGTLVQALRLCTGRTAHRGVEV
jgi:hypothetical protein